MQTFMLFISFCCSVIVAAPLALYLYFFPVGGAFNLNPQTSHMMLFCFVVGASLFTILAKKKWLSWSVSGTMLYGILLGFWAAIEVAFNFAEFRNQIFAIQTTSLGLPITLSSVAFLTILGCILALFLWSFSMLSKTLEYLIEFEK